MTRIRKLPIEVVSRIAAGEVVERPMNIVKELVENSIDANSSEIVISIKEGGKDLVKIQDNGDGIPVEELDVAFQLHTTSKLENNDPSLVTSLGFRGEALASIASVSRIEVSSRSEADTIGRKLIIEAGSIIDDKEQNLSKGTSIEVTGIFFNTPARRKFLKSASTERKRITDLIANYCLMYPQIHFRLEEITNTKSMIRVESPSRKSIMAVIFDVLGPEIANELVAFDKKIGDWELKGYISKPHLTRSDRSFQFINVNGRPIRNKSLQSTIEEAYGSQLMRKTHPVVILKIDGPVDAVDFNIHPQKSEIRFRNDEGLFEQIPQFILETLENEIELPSLQKQKLGNLRKRTIKPNDTKKSNDLSKSIGENISNKSTTLTTENAKTKPFQTIQKKSNSFQESLFEDSYTDNKSDHQILGHIMNKFAVIYADDELWLMDVHAADERVKFELYSQTMKRNVSSQQFLYPLTISLSPSEKQLVLDNQSEFEKYGLKLSNTAENKLLVHSMPVYYDQDVTPESIQNLLIDIVSHLTDDDQDKGEVENPLEVMEYNIIARLACHGSVRSGYPVSRDKISRILNELLNCTFPWTCAHGRPTIIRMPKSRLESIFKR